MIFDEATEILINKFVPNSNGAIYVDGTETESEKQAINYLCSKWDFTTINIAKSEPNKIDIGLLEGGRDVPEVQP